MLFASPSSKSLPAHHYDSLKAERLQGFGPGRQPWVNGKPGFQPRSRGTLHARFSRAGVGEGQDKSMAFARRDRLCAAPPSAVLGRPFVSLIAQRFLFMQLLPPPRVVRADKQLNFQTKEPDRKSTRLNSSP